MTDKVAIIHEKMVVNSKLFKEYVKVTFND